MIVGILFALVPRLLPQPTATDQNTAVPAAAGPTAKGSIDSLHIGSAVTIIARGHSDHGRSIAVTRDPMLIDGWALTERKGTPKAVVYRIDNGAWFAATYGASRPDVASAFKDPALATCGYIARVPIATIPMGHHVIHFAVDTGSQLEPLDDPVQIDVP